MEQSILDHRYDLQYVLYLLALHRQLKARLPDYDYDRHVGGALYLFLRGTQAPEPGVLFRRPPRELIQQLDRMFQGKPEPQDRTCVGTRSIAMSRTSPFAAVSLAAASG